MAEYSVVVIPSAAKPRLVERTAEEAAGIERAVSLVPAKARPVERTAETMASIERSVLYVAVKEAAARVQFVNRGYHAGTLTYYYWTSFDHIDSSGAYWPHGSSPPFGEISDVIGITRLPAPE